MAGKTVFITGASRGIGRSLAIRCGRDGANVVVVAKTGEPHARLPGTVYTTAAEVEAAGGRCLPCVVDIRNDLQVEKAVQKCIERFGAIDILVNNASAISLTGVQETSMKFYDLMHDINVRGTFLCSKACLPYLCKSTHGKILTMGPPLNMNPKWFKLHTAYTMSKYAMSMCSFGLSQEFKSSGVSINTLWPRTAIHSAAMDLIGGSLMKTQCRRDDIVVDAAHILLTSDLRETGQSYLDERVLRRAGQVDFKRYNFVKDPELIIDFFVDDQKDFPADEERIKQRKINITSSKKITVDSMMQTISKRLQKIKKSVNTSIAIYITGESNWLIDYTDGVGIVKTLTVDPLTSIDRKATMTLNKDILYALLNGQININAAYLDGLLSVKGDTQNNNLLAVLFNLHNAKL